MSLKCRNRHNAIGSPPASKAHLLSALDSQLLSTLAAIAVAASMSQPFDEDGGGGGKWEKPSIDVSSSSGGVGVGSNGSAAPSMSSSSNSPSKNRRSNPPPPPRPQQRSSRTELTRMAQQPHGHAAIGPSSSNISSSAASISGMTAASTAGNSIVQHQHISVESPLPTGVQRGLGDRSNDKRKNAALEIEALIKSLQETNNFAMIRNVIVYLSKDFCTSMNFMYRKGGLIGLAATAIGLHQNTSNYLNILLPPVLHCFDDPEARVRYYACESLYNIAKVSRFSILTYFNQIFEGLAKLFADVDPDVKNGATLLDRLIKDIVTEADHFSVDQFLPLLQNYIRRTNPYIRQLIVGWVTLLDSVPDISMLDYLPDFLDGLFNMLSDSNRDIRQAADSALADFLREVSVSTVVEFGPIISILVMQSQSKERLNRLTAMTWLAELVHHPYSGGDSLLPFFSNILGALLFCISDSETEIRLVAERTNDDCRQLIRETQSDFELEPILDALTSQLYHQDVPTKLAALGWINMLMEKRTDMNQFTEQLLQKLLRTLSDASDAVVLLTLQVLSRISLAQQPELTFQGGGDDYRSHEEAQFRKVLDAILDLFMDDRELLETRGPLIIRKLCVLLNAKSVYMRMADIMADYEMTDDDQPADMETLQFVSTMVQTLNLILLTASELQDLRTILAQSFEKPNGQNNHGATNDTNHRHLEEEGEQGDAFARLFHCWSHNPVATFSLCLLARTYDISFSLVQRFSSMPDISVGFLMQIDKLVHLLESPIFCHLRLQLLDVHAPHHEPLLKSIYGLLMCLPQGDAFRLLNDRLTAVCNLRDSLGLSTMPGPADAGAPIVSRSGLVMELLLERFDHVTELHRVAQERSQSTLFDPNKRTEVDGSATGATPGSTRTQVLVSSSRVVNDAMGNSPTRITVHQPATG